MAKSVLKPFSKEVAEINFVNKTKKSYFKEFNNNAINCLGKKKKTIKVIDYIFPLKNLIKKKYKIKDHVNLSGENPLTGANFISLTDLYKTKDGIIVCSLPYGVHPSNAEKKILLKNNIQAYCYNLVQASIYAAFLGLKVKAYGIIKNSS